LLLLLLLLLQCCYFVVVIVLAEDDKHPMFRSVVSVIRLYGKFLIVEIIPEMKNEILKINFPSKIYRYGSEKPFLLFRKSGANPTKLFISCLTHTFSDWKKVHFFFENYLIVIIS